MADNDPQRDTNFYLHFVQTEEELEQQGINGSKE